ncbi:uncharacterized protein LOC132608035 [Lycium barbarum]|uniref:uncharacterized protein LOC132608035 n=1 Tax=Lycium barbarum TaxID=112863 RepID=UPI00293E4935|nr:uncharacterized protein LOC132608035 [Lycium barbarum]
MIVVAQHRNQYYGRSRAHDPARFESFGSPPNCRAFESRAGSFQTQSKSCKKPVTKRDSSGSLSPKTRSPLASLPVNTLKSYSEDQKKSRKPARSSTVAIPFNLKVDVGSRNEVFLNDEFPFSELWAGPAYSNSPSPSSLPMPKFSLRPKRTASLEFPASASDIDLCPVAKSAPASPTRERSPSPGIVFDCTDSATQTLRRMLNLEITDG